MAATVDIIEKNTAGGTATVKTSGTVRHKTADNATVDLNNPIVKPGGGSNWSFQKWLKAKVSSGTFTQITNVKAYTDGANGFGTGILLWWKAVTAFATPALETASAGYTDAFSYTSGAPLALNAGTVVATGEMGDHLVSAMQVQSTAAGGLLTGEQMTLSWDEI